MMSGNNKVTKPDQNEGKHFPMCWYCSPNGRSWICTVDL